MRNDASDYPLYLSDNAVIAKSEYEESEKLVTVRTHLRDRRYKASDSEITARVLSHWDSQGILPQGSKSEGWRVFTLVELVWLEAVKAMRDFGLPLEKIKNAKDNILDWSEKHERYPIFEFYISQAWLTNTDPQIVLTRNGAEIGTPQAIQGTILHDGSHHILQLSLKAILKDLKLEVEEANILFSLTKEEKEVLGILRIQGSDKIQIKAPGGKIKEIDYTETLLNPPHNFEIEKQMYDGNVYGTITTQFEGGKRRSVQVTRKKKL